MYRWDKFPKEKGTKTKTEVDGDHKTSFKTFNYLHKPMADMWIVSLFDSGQIAMLLFLFMIVEL